MFRARPIFKVQPAVKRSLVPVILSGGSGTRLWPLSRELRPKQFLPLVTERTLLQETAARALALGDFVQRPLLVCNEQHRFLAAEQLRSAGVEPAGVVLEPIGRNTAPAVAVAALEALRGASTDADPLLLVLPADHVILDQDAFGAAVAAALDAAGAGRLVTFGVVPDRPETGYGYIQSGRAQGEWSEVERFVEKPDRATAERYVASGSYLWNSGMFVFSARTVLAELDVHAPGLTAGCARALEAAKRDRDFVWLDDSFRACPSVSIDNAVMEKTARAAVVPLRAGWNDIGSWIALHDVLPRDGSGNAVAGDVSLQACRDSYVAATSRYVAAIGLDGIVIVETADAVLVAARDQCQSVKDVVAGLKAADRLELVRDTPKPR
jgi:mannose-1-phosphate guanylyltransferase/mannose-6-phosphate isomerase